MTRLGAVWGWLVFAFAVVPTIGAVTTEIGPGDELVLRGGTYILSSRFSVQLTAEGNAGSGGLNGLSGGFDASRDIGLDLVAASYSGRLPQDVFPAAGSLLIGAANPDYLADDDFNGQLRGGAADIGAYLWQAGGNPGWALQEDFKELLVIFEDGFESGNLARWSTPLP